MTSPISNDKSMAVNQDRNLRTDARETAKPNGQTEVSDRLQTEAAAPEQSEPDVGRAAHLFNSESSVQKTESGAIQTREQARSLVDQIKAQLAQDPAGALQAFGQVNAQQTGAALGQAPA